jgi:hypothetical protein
MDAHFNEYLAAVAGMHELVGEPVDETPTEFHASSEAEDRPVIIPFSATRTRARASARRFREAAASARP